VICYRYILWTVFLSNNNISEHADDKLNSESTWMSMKRKKSSSSQFEILYISKFEKHEQDIYENRRDSRDKFSSHLKVHQTVKDCMQHIMIMMWCQSINVFQLFSYRCEIEWTSRYWLQSFIKIQQTC